MKTNFKAYLIGGLFVSISWFCASCEKQEPIIIDNSGLTFNGTYFKTMDDVNIVVSPTTIICGEEFSVKGTHNDDKSVAVTIVSKSLDLNEKMVTPFTIKTRIDEEGSYDLKILYKHYSPSLTIDVKSNEQ